VIERGNPADVILALEKTLAPDLVVMATHGRRGFARLVLGSVTEKVVRESIKPVLTVRPMPADKATPLRRRAAPPADGVFDSARRARISFDRARGGI
jgi:hypothetical protein